MLAVFIGESPALYMRNSPRMKTIQKNWWNSWNSRPPLRNPFFPLRLTARLTRLSFLPAPFSRGHDLQPLLHDSVEITLVEGQKRIGLSLPRALCDNCVVGLSPSHMTFGKPTEEVAVGFRVERNDSDRAHKVCAQECVGIRSREPVWRWQTGQHRVCFNQGRGRHDHWLAQPEAALNLFMCCFVVLVPAANRSYHAACIRQKAWHERST